MMKRGSRAHWQITLNLGRALADRLDPDRFAVLPEFGVDLGPLSHPISRYRCGCGGGDSRRFESHRAGAHRRSAFAFVGTGRSRGQSGGVSQDAEPDGLPRLCAGRNESVGFGPADRRISRPAPTCWKSGRRHSRRAVGARFAICGGLCPRTPRVIFSQAPSANKKLTTAARS